MPEDSQSDSMFGCLLQLFWSLAGPGLLLAAGALLIVNHPPFGWVDVLFLGLAVAVGMARVLDRQSGSSSSPAARLKYLGGLAAAVALILFVAHVVAPRFA